MASPRLPFLWPMLYRTLETPAARSTRAAARFRALHHASSRYQQENLSQRYGPANEPPPHIGNNVSSTPPKPEPAKKAQERIAPPPAKIEKATKGEETTAKSAEVSTAKDVPPAKGEKTIESLLDAIPTPSQVDKKEPSPLTKDSSPSQSTTTTPTSAITPEPPSSQPASSPSHAPHLDTPRHVHHFDTYSLVRRLGEGGWSDEQAITLMKAMRLQMAANLDLANSALVSKSMVENETYLFRAACAELKTEVTSRRRAEQDKMRTERAQLQHEVEILSQRVGQEMAGLKDDLRGMFDDRKMSVRNEQRSVESRLQQINYKITVALQADAKSDVEGLRWVMTRRVIIALGAVIFMVVGSLKLYSNALHENEVEAKRRASSKSHGGTQTDERVFGAGDAVHAAVSAGEMLRVNEGDNPSFVSLG